MASIPLSPRLVAMPLLWLLSGRQWLAERGAPMVRLRLDNRTELPAASDLRTLAEAPEVRGLWLTIEHVGGGWASLAAAHEALLHLRSCGKLVVVELERAGNAELLLASAADRVWLRPTLECWLVGVGASLRFAGNLLDRVGLAFDVEAAGAYKSFGESFTRAWPSPENREATTVLVRDLQDWFATALAKARRLDAGAVEAAFADAPFSAEEAVRRGLCDATLYPHEVEAAVDELCGRQEVRTIDFARWLRIDRARRRLSGWISGGPRVAVLHLVGPVVDGAGSRGAEQIAATPVIEMLDALEEADSIAAVVLHIRSPGGSATASDLVWRAVRKLGEHKPVVAVLGDVAASGGYYIAVAASEIVAHPITMTGSIGVVGGKIVARPALERVGVHTELVLGAPQADFFSDAPFTDEQRARFRAGLERAYSTFVGRVATGRRRPAEALEPFARGRIWSGTRALEHGLVDALGSIEEGVIRAGRLASVPGARRVDVRLARPGARMRRLLRSFVESSVPELSALRLPSSVRLLLESAGTPLYFWPWEVDAG